MVFQNQLTHILSVFVAVVLVVVDGTPHSTDIFLRLTENQKVWSAMCSVVFCLKEVSYHHLGTLKLVQNAVAVAALLS